MFTYWALSLASVDDLWIYALVGMGGGLFLFYRGFRMLRRKRLILNTPTSKIRSASLGLVEISGLADGPYSIPAPITGRSCYYYRTQAWELRKSGKSEEWKQVADESQHVPFYVDDNTGKLLVNPQGANLDLHRDFHEEYSNSILFGKDMPDGVRRFLARHGVSGEHKIRIDEHCIKPKNALFILGTLAENPGFVATSTPIQTELGNTLRFKLTLPGSTTTLGASFGTEAPSTDSGFRAATHHEIIRLTPDKKPAASAELTQQGKIAAALVKAGVTNPAAWAAAGINDPASAIAASHPSSTGAATATAPECSAFELHPKVVLMKGENDPTFLISWRSQRDVVSSLGWKSTACIWGGPGLILLSVYVLLLRMGWL